MRFVGRPGSLAVLKDGLVSEMHRWLLLGQNGRSIRQLGVPDARVRTVARAVAVRRKDYAHGATIGGLAAAGGMSRPAFHKHFPLATSLSPLQFEKQPGLVEARRLIQSKGKSLGSAAFNVGFESASQFSPEYAGMFGLPPLKDKRAAAEFPSKRRSASLNDTCVFLAFDQRDCLSRRAGLALPNFLRAMFSMTASPEVVPDAGGNREGLQRPCQC